MKGSVWLLNIVLILGLLVGGCTPAATPMPTPETVEATLPSYRRVGPSEGMMGRWVGNFANTARCWHR